MKITKTQLREIIREEIQTLNEKQDDLSTYLEPLFMQMLIGVLEDAKDLGIINNKSDLDNMIKTMEKEKGLKVKNSTKATLVKKLKLK